LLKAVPRRYGPGYSLAGTAGEQGVSNKRSIRIFTTVLTIGALVASQSPALAQARRPHQEDKKEDKKPVVDEKAYKAALEKIPEPKEKYDPWSGARPTEPAKKTKQ
jgi:hypothetical protein